MGGGQGRAKLPVRYSLRSGWVTIMGRARGAKEGEATPPHLIHSHKDRLNYDNEWVAGGH